MMKKLIVELDGQWVLSHRDDEILPIAAIESELKALDVFECDEGSLTSLFILFDENKIGADEAKSKVESAFLSKYPQDNIKEILSIQIEDYEESFEEPEIEEDKEEPKVEEPKHKEQKTDVLQRINSLVGAADFKSLAKEIAELSPEIKRAGTYEVFFNQCYLFSIGEGRGLTTYLTLLAQLISELGLCKMNANPVREEKLGSFCDGIEPFEDAMRALGNGDKKSVKLLCIDISEWMDNTDNRFFKQFLRIVEKHSEEFIVVFRVPFVDKDVLARIRFSLNDLLNVRTISFPPLNRNEIKEFAEVELDRFKFTLTKTAWDCFFERISEEKSDGKFYGINTIKKVVKELVYYKQLQNARAKKTDTVIGKNEAKNICSGTDDTNLSGFEMLSKLVGSESIKKRIEEIIAQIDLSLKDSSVERPCIHMRFVGNPGTGKTTVARIIGKILKERGVLRIGNFYEYAGRDFCGRYVGETAPKTASICRDAYGSVLFIDEAYSLYRGDDNSRDYGREALDTLIAEMENHRNDFVVIMAGYTDDMDKLMAGNMGLASRMPYTIEFPNFTREQLYEIFESMVKARFKYDEQLLTIAHEYFNNLPDEIIQAKEFSNARFVRNLFERTWAKAAMRCQLSGKQGIVLTKDDFEHASADKEFAVKATKKTRIGF